MRANLVDAIFRFRTSIFCLTLLRFYALRAEEIVDDDIKMDYTFSNWDKSIDWNETIDELNQMMLNKESCLPEKYLCQPSDASTSHSGTFKDLCDCNEKCTAYGGCCIDTAAQQWNRGVIPDEDRYVCGSLHHMEREKGVVMIGNCQRNFTGSSIIEQFCSRNPINNNVTYAYLLDIPAISAKTNLTYINYYCALCNDDAKDIIPPSQFKIVCNGNLKTYSKQLTSPGSLPLFADFISTSSYDLQRRLWIKKIHDTTLVCYFQNIKYQDQLKVNKLQEKMSCRYTSQYIRQLTDGNEYISTCSSNWKNKEDVKKCRLYSAKLIDIDTLRLYKNPHCARCNFVNLSSSRIYCKVYSHPQVLWRTATTYSIQIKSPMQSQCEHENIWDPIREKCYSIPSRLMHFVWKVSMNAYRPFLPAFFTNNYQKLIVSIISEIFLFLHLILYLRKTDHSRHENILLCLCCCLFIANLLIFVEISVSETSVLLTPIVLALQYFWSVSFFWMNVLSIDIFRTFRNRTRIVSLNKDRDYILYNIYAWGIPLLLIVLIYIIVHILNPQWYGGTNRYMPTFLVPAEYLELNTHIGWLANSVLFLIPISVLVLVNFVLLVMTSCKIYQKSKDARLLYLNSLKMYAKTNEDSERKLKKKQQLKNNVGLYIRLGLLQGTTWMAWLLACFLDMPLFIQISQIVNGLQGTYIFFIFDVANMCALPFWQGKSTPSKDISTASTNTDL